MIPVTKKSLAFSKPDDEAKAFGGVETGMHMAVDEASAITTNMGFS